MAASNFPANPSDGDQFINPANGYTYEFQVDPDSPTSQGKWTTRIRPNSDFDDDYLKLDGSNGPITDDLTCNGDLLLPNLPGPYVDDAAAATGGVPQFGLYHNSGAVRIRLT